MITKQKFDEDNQRTYDDYEKQIWKQVNQYMKDFGVENNYTYILGAEGSWQLMYAKENNNITKEVVEFINKKYKGITR